jgi:hypothetical protein
MAGVAALLVGGRANAECGDYLQHVAKSGSSPVGLGDESLTPKTPCHGPNCSQAPQAPPLDPMTVPPPPAPQKACEALVVEGDLPPLLTATTAAEPNPPLSPHLDGILRPPRS